MEGEVLEEVDLEADGDDLTEVGSAGSVFAAGAEIGQTEVPGAGERQARGDDGGVEIESSAELDLEAKLHGCGRKCFAIEHPSAAFGKARGEDGEETMSFFVAEALNIERMHCVV